MGEVYRDTTLVAAAIDATQAQLQAGQAEQEAARAARQAEAADLPYYYEVDETDEEVVSAVPS